MDGDGNTVNTSSNANAASALLQAEAGLATSMKGVEKVNLDALSEQHKQQNKKHQHSEHSGGAGG